MSPLASRSARRPRSASSGRTRLCTALVAAVLALAFAAPASAGPKTLKRSIEHLTLWPVDLALSPVVAGKTIVDNMQSIDDSTAVRIAYPVPGFFWNTFVQSGAAVLRGFTGVFELGPGLVLLPFDAELDPLFDPVEDNPSLVNWDTPVYRVKTGVTYTNPGGAQDISF